jgi:hypothetical protein
MELVAPRLDPGVVFAGEGWGGMVEKCDVLMGCRLCQESEPVHRRGRGASGRVGP